MFLEENHYESLWRPGILLAYPHQQIGPIGSDRNSFHHHVNNGYATVWEPRISFAYDLFGHPTTSIRDGYGIYTVREDISALDNLAVAPPAVAGTFGPSPTATGLANYLVGAIPPVNPTPDQLAPFVPTASFIQGFSPVPFCIGGPVPGYTTAGNACFSGTAINYFTPELLRHWISSTTQQWNFGIQRSFGKGWALKATYVGTKGTHLREGNDMDYARLASPQKPIVLSYGGQTFTITQNTFANINTRALYSRFAPAAFELFAQDANSHYNAFQLTLKHRFSRGLSAKRVYFLRVDGRHLNRKRRLRYTLQRSVDRT
jgi:hypothetical protein